MPGREQEQWLDRLGMSGIRRDVLQQKSDETVLYECHNLDPLSVSGSIRKIPGRGNAVLTSLDNAGNASFSPSVRNVSLVSLNGSDYVTGVGHQSGDVSSLSFYFEALPASSGILTPVSIFTCNHPEYLSPPVGYAGGCVTPRGESYLPAITSYIDIEVDDTTLDDELDYTGPAHREAKTGFPWAGFVYHDGILTNAHWHAPFATGTDVAADRFDDTISGDTQVGANGFGCVGTATASGETMAHASEIFCQFSNAPGADELWEYGYAAAGDAAATGWGYKHGAGASTTRWILRWAALGYVYVYADGTTSEMFVVKWKNEFTTFSDPAAGGPARLGYPVSINPDLNNPGPLGAVNTNLCVIAWKVRCRLPASLLSDHNVVGVRVFYSHRSMVQGATDYTTGYNGWTNDQDIFGGMREVMYLDEDDARVGYCRIETAEYVAVSGEDSGDAGTLECAYFNNVLCPCEATVAQYAEINDSFEGRAVKNPMTLGRLWSEIRGEIDSSTGVLADLGDGRVTVSVIENGQVVKTYAPDGGSDGGSTFTTRCSTLVNHVSFVQPRTSVASYGCFQQAGRLFHWGVQIQGERDVDWLSIYPTHIDQDSLPHPGIVRLDLKVPIRLGEIRACAPVGRDAVIGTTGGIAVMSFGSGLVQEWSRRVIDMDVSVQRPGMIRTVGGMCYIVGVDGHVYLYRDGASELQKITESLSAPDGGTLLPHFVGLGESYPTDFVFNDVAISYAPSEERIVICYRYNWKRVLTLCYDIKSGAFVTMSRFFVAAANTLGNIPYVSTGSTVMGLWRAGNNFVEGADSGVSSASFSGHGEISQSGEQITVTTITDKDIHNLPSDISGGGRAMVGWSLEQILTAVAGLPPGGTLFYRSFGWVSVTTYTPEYSVMDATGQFVTTDPLYDTGGKFTVVPDLFWYRKTGSAENIATAVPWKLSFEKFIVSPGRRQILSMIMLKGTIQDTFTIKFYADGSATAHTTLTLAGGFTKYKQIRTRVPAKHSVKIVMEATAGQVDVDGVFDLQRVGLMYREGGRLGQGA